MRDVLAVDNELFALARQGRRLPHIVLIVVVSVVATIVLGILGAIVAALVMQVLIQMGAPASGSAFSTGWQTAVFLIAATSPIFFFIWAWVRLFDRRPYWTLGLRLRGAAFYYARGFVIGFVMFGASVGIAAMLGYITFEGGDSLEQGSAALGGVLIVALGWIVQGASEEVLCRG